MIKTVKMGSVYRIAEKVSYVYLIIPYIIFSIGWMKIGFSIPFVLVLLYIGVRLSAQNTRIIGESKQVIDKKDIFTLVISFVIITIWVGMSGIGVMAFQTEDHIWRNGLFETLVEENWPVVSLEFGTGLSYYIAFWLPAACVGKVFGLGVGYKFQIIWAVLGVFLFYLLVCKIINKIAIWPLVIFILFSGMDILGELVIGNSACGIFSTEHLEWWASQWQFSSQTTQLFWVFNQAIPAWLAVAMILNMKDNTCVLFVWSLMLLYSTFPFIGMVAVVPSVLLNNIKQRKKESNNVLKDIFSFDNLIGGGCVFLVSMLYLSKGGAETKFSFVDLSGGGWLLYLVFIMLEVGCLFISVYWNSKRQLIYYCIIGWLCLCPILDIYGEKNFCMRASIPALVVLYIIVIRAIIQGMEQRKHKQVFIILIILLIGGITPLHEMVRTITMTKVSYVGKEISIMQAPATYDQVMKNEYETTDIEKNIFFKYIAK